MVGEVIFKDSKSGQYKQYLHYNHTDNTIEITPYFYWITSIKLGWSLNAFLKAGLEVEFY